MIFFDITGKRVWVAGHNGMVGSAIVRNLRDRSCEVLTVGRAELDLREQAAVSEWVAANRPDAIIMAAAKVGGIWANDNQPADFLLQNLQMECAVFDAAHRHGVAKMLFLGSSCIYPKMAAQPLVEESLLTGPLEPTNQWYAIAKIAGIKLAESFRLQYGCDFISAMPTNLYGPNDSFDLKTSHVLPALIRKAHEAKVSGDRTLIIWGSGTPRREFLHVDDLAAACVFLLEHYSDAPHVNIGFGEDISIRDLAEMVVEIVGFEGEIELDADKPDGTPRKLMSSDRIRSLGWEPKIGLRQGIADTYAWYLASLDAGDDGPRPL